MEEEKQEITPETFPRARDLVTSMPAHLKDHANYDKIQRTVVEALASKHSHSDMMEWAGCAGCQRRFAERGSVLKKLGFKHPAQYMAWKKIHETIKARIPFPKYNS